MSHPFVRMLQDEDAHLQEDEFEELHTDDDHKPWGDVIVASLIIQLITLTGLVVTVAIGYYGRLRGNKDQLIHLMSFKIVPSFACGALLATAVLLVIPESLILLGGGHASHGGGSQESHAEEDDDGHDNHDHFLRSLQEDVHEEGGNEAEASWKFGAALLSGFLFPILLHVFFPSKHDHAIQDEDVHKVAVAAKADTPTTTNTAAEAAGETAEMNHEEEGSSDVSPETKVTERTTSDIDTVDWTLACSIIVGDFFHNFTDGVFLGTSFLLCSRTVGYTLVATTIYHELAQEIADFALLHHHCGLPMWKAVLYNFVSGFSVMIGALVILSFDMSEEAQGTTLAIAAGIYIYIAACECVPRIQAVRKGPKDTLLFLAFFVLGAIPIGLVLLNHEHCEAGHEEHADDDGDDHDHRWLY